MLPIRWDYLPMGFSSHKGKYSFDFDQRTDMQSMNKLLHQSGWKRSFYRIKNDITRYNEMTYFHAHVGMTLFDLQQQTEPNEFVVDQNKIMAFYEIEITSNENALYSINAKGKEYVLNLTDINLHVYSTGIAILVFGCENYQYSNPNDILIINDFGRRIYPHFLGGEGILTTPTKNSFLANSISITAENVNFGNPLTEDFSDYDSLVSKETHGFENGKYNYRSIVKFPKIITGLFNSNFVFEAKDEAENKIRWNLLGDDRMFFQCWFGHNETASNIKKKFCEDKDGNIVEIDKGTASFYGFENDCYWYAFMNGDNSTDISMQNDTLLKLDIDKSTYARWVNYGTIMGFTRDSFVSITNESEFAKSLLSTHFTTLYYQMAVLSLAQRASVLRFSSEVSNLADLGKSNEDKATQLIEKLYLNYIEFINKIYHREVTPTIQGIEMYEQFQKAMIIERDANSLKNEIAELFNFATMVKQDKLTKVATFFLPFSIVFSIIGASIISDPLKGKPIFWLFMGLSISIGIAYVTLKWGKIKTTFKLK